MGAPASTAIVEVERVRGIVAGVPEEPLPIGAVAGEYLEVTIANLANRVEVRADGIVQRLTLGAFAHELNGLRPASFPVDLHGGSVVPVVLGEDAPGATGEIEFDQPQRVRIAA